MAGKRKTHRPEMSGGTDDTLRTALAILLRAFDAAHEFGCSVWDFAVGIRAFERVAVDETTLRRLVAKGFAEHGVDETRHAARRRRFRRAHHLTFTEKSCFVLTPAGATFARGHVIPTSVSIGKQATLAPSAGKLFRGDSPQSTPPPPVLPIWDRDQRELRVGKVVVKRFREPAPNQETILSAFQDEDWPRQIYDPLPQRHGMDCKKRLRDAIHSLNLHQLHTVLHFHADGTGQRICWEPIARLRRSIGAASSERR